MFSSLFFSYSTSSSAEDTSNTTTAQADDLHEDCSSSSRIEPLYDANSVEVTIINKPMNIIDDTVNNPFIATESARSSAPLVDQNYNSPDAASVVDNDVKEQESRNANELSIYIDNNDVSSAAANTVAVLDENNSEAQLISSSSNNNQNQSSFFSSWFGYLWSSSSNNNQEEPLQQQGDNDLKSKTTISESAALESSQKKEPSSTVLIGPARNAMCEDLHKILSPSSVIVTKNMLSNLKLKHISTDMMNEQQKMKKRSYKPRHPLLQEILDVTYRKRMQKIICESVLLLQLSPSDSSLLNENDDDE